MGLLTAGLSSEMVGVVQPNAWAVNRIFVSPIPTLLHFYVFGQHTLPGIQTHTVVVEPYDLSQEEPMITLDSGKEFRFKQNHCEPQAWPQAPPQAWPQAWLDVTARGVLW